MLRLEVVSLRSHIGESEALVVRRLRGRCARFVFALSAIEILIEIEQAEQIVFSFQLRVLLVQLDEVLRGTVSLFGDEADIVLLLKFEHLVLGAPQIFFDLDELLGNRRRDGRALVFPHALFEIEILLHHRVQKGLGVIRCAPDGDQIENRGARFLRDRDLDLDRLHFRMGRADEGFRAAPHFRALHELNLSAVEIDAVFAVDGALRDIHFSGEHHFAHRLEGGRRLINEPGLDEKPHANSQERNPPAALEERFVTVKAREERGAPRSGCGTIVGRGWHKVTC